VLLTHEHIDHLRGLGAFVRASGAAVWATAPVLRYITDRGLVGCPCRALRGRAGEESLVEGMRVLAFPTMHDTWAASGPVCTPTTTVSPSRPIWVRHRGRARSRAGLRSSFS
jgi:phosphoribosyl 1,2-cyclic phosphodiesterase